MILLLVTACAQPGEPPLRVLAAASLTEALTEVAEQFEARSGREVVVSFDGTSRLAAQLEAGVPADLFVSADAAWMDLVAQQGLIRPETRVDLLGNRLVVVVPADSGAPPRDLGGFDRIALAGESVPAGRYAREGLSRGAYAVPPIVSGDNVRTVLAWVARGEAPVGVVYATDAAVEPRVRVAFTLPAESHTPVVYPAAITTEATDLEGVAGFLEFLRGEGSGAFEAAGFTVLAP